MQVYKFGAIVSKEGIFQDNTNAATKFVEKWSGILKDVDIENSKFQYLNEKYK